MSTTRPMTWDELAQENGKLRASNTELKAQVGILREAMEKIREIWWRDEPNEEKEVDDYKQIIEVVDKVLSLTPAQAGERLRKLNEMVERANKWTLSGSWGGKELDDFLQSLDALTDEEVKSDAS